MGELFQKGYEERRAEFVFGRFHQEDEFGWERGDPPLEAWLEAQAVAAQPNDRWHGLLERCMFGGTLSAELVGDLLFANFGKTTMARGAAMVMAHLQIGGAAHLLPRMVEDKSVHLYLLWRPEGQGSTSAVVTIPPTPDNSRSVPAFLVEAGGSLAIGMHAVLEQHYLRHLLFVWSRGETFAGYMVWRQARERAVECIRARLAASRARAERDFNDAVACSAGGAKIVGGVEHVLVFEPSADNTALAMLRLYPASAFQGASQILRIRGEDRFVRVGLWPDFVSWLREKKIVPRVLRERAMRNSVTADGWLRLDPSENERLDECMWHRLPLSGSQMLMRQDGRGLLITPRQFCPDPLPTAEFEDLLPAG